MAEKYVGRRVKRTEDPRLIKGLAHYVDDIGLPNTLHVAFVRSMYAHARINGIDTAEASKAAGVVAVYTGKDIASKDRMCKRYSAIAVLYQSSEAKQHIASKGNLK